MSFFQHLECSQCTRRFDADGLHHLCPDCRRPLLARYDLDAARSAISLAPTDLAQRSRDVWRFAELQPVRDTRFRFTLGEGGTPLVAADRLRDALQSRVHLYIKDESLNPTASFKARGMAVAIARAAELGVRAVTVPSAGNAACAMSAYAARAGMEAHVYMPGDVPANFIAQCRALGATVHLIDGLITDCGRASTEDAERFGRFDVSTLKEPYRLEGKKTLGYELAEQMQWSLPDVIIYPTGGGTGLVGMWKAFDEMEAMGWIDDRRPRMVSVQSTGCAPIVRAFEKGAKTATPWEGAKTVADGLRVPAAVGDVLMLNALRASNGTAVAVSDADLMEGAGLMARTEGILAAPEGGATVAALRVLSERGWVHDGERVVLFNTGNALSYAHLWASEKESRTVEPARP
ncbi:MAG TPA: threonine synthase [Candidatus Krumholzibacteria bacterium]|nr:threonine synthase [Candidatus Krumholzibacteria bacterium]